MKNIKLFLKGIVVGTGGIAPGLSGSVLMVILGLYSKVINTIATLFKDFKKSFLYLLPLGLGILVGIVTFSRIISYSMEHFEIQTRLTFIGLLIGTIPLFYKEVKKEKSLKKSNYLMMAITFMFGMYFLTFSNSMTSSGDLNIFKSFILGFIGISATIIPGIDGASVLSAFGLYNNWLDLTSLKNIDLAIYIPAGCGIIAGVFILSMLINKMIKKNYTATFSVLFGFFLSVIPSVLKTEDGSFISLGNNNATYIGISLFIVGVIASYFFGKLGQKKESVGSEKQN